VLFYVTSSTMSQMVWRAFCTRTGRGPEGGSASRFANAAAHAILPRPRHCCSCWRNYFFSAQRHQRWFSATQTNDRQFASREDERHSIRRAFWQESSVTLSVMDGTIPTGRLEKWFRRNCESSTSHRACGRVRNRKIVASQKTWLVLRTRLRVARNLPVRIVDMREAPRFPISPSG